MPRAARDSIVERGANRVRIEEGRILNVNMRRWTADVRTRESQRTYLDVQWSNPYFHFAGGEGIFFMPEVGAKVMVCRPSSSDPFIMAFTTTFERGARQPDDTGDTPAVSEHSTDPAPDEGNDSVTFRSGRPYLQQGDIMLRTRDKNHIWLRRGGVLEVASTALSKRLYIPLLNYIRDICENYSMWTAGGALSWTVERSDTDPDDEARAVLSIAARQNAQDELASVSVQIGHVDDTKRMRVVIAPQAINTRTFEVTGEASYTLDIDEEGTVESFAKKDDKREIQGELEWQIRGQSTYRYSGGLTEEITGDHNVSVSGNHTMEASSSTERCSAGKVIEAASVDLGAQGGRQVVVATEAFMAFMAGHTHPVSGSATGIPVPSLPPIAFTSKRVKAV